MPKLTPTPPQDLPDQPINQTRPTPSAELVDRLKTDSVFASSFLDEKSVDELTPYKEEYADQLMLSNEINDILLDSEVARFRPERVSQQIAYNCASHLWDEPLSDETCDFLDKMSEMLPDKFAAYKRDIARILKGRVEPRPLGLPYVSDGNFEDPFGVGRSYISALAKDPFEKTDILIAMAVGKGDTAEVFAQALSEASLNDSEGFFSKYTGGDLRAASPVHQICSVVADVYFHVESDYKDRDPVTVWNQRMKQLTYVGLGAKIALFMSSRNRMPEKSQAKIISKLLRDYFDGSEQNNVQALIALHQSPAGTHFAASLQKYPTLLHNFARKSCQGSPLESAFSLRVLQRYCEEVGNQVAVPTILASLYPGARNLGHEGAASAVTRLLGTFLDGKPECYEAALRHITKSDQFIQKIPITLIRNGEPEEIRKYLREKYAVFGVFPDDVLDEVLNNRLKNPKEATEELYLELGEAELPADFDQELAAIEIFDRTSLPLAETRHINLNGVLGTPFRVTILPATGPDFLGAWTLNIQFTSFRGHRFVNESVQVDFEECELVTEVSLAHRELVERIGIYCAHQYFVKQSVEQSLDDLHQKPSSDRPSEDFNLPDTDAEITVEDKDERDYQQRKQQPLTIDITTEDKRRLSERRDCLRSTLDTNKAVICRLLSGEYKDEDLENALLHRVAPGSPTSQPVYQRVPDDDVLEAVIDDCLAEKNWYFLNSLPHTRNLGYHLFQNSAEGEETDDAKIPLWLLKRKQRTPRAMEAYENYTESGFPDLSDFEEVEAWLGVTADAVYEKGHSIQLKTEEGEMLVSGSTTKKDSNAAIALKVNNGVWMKQWLKSQKRILEEEIEDILASELSDEEKTPKIEVLRNKIKDLPQQMGEIMKQSGLHIGRDKAAVCRSARLTIAKVRTGTTFNQGHFMPINRLTTSLDNSIESG